VNELLRDQSSHLWASLAGWSWVASWGDVATVQLLEMYANTHRDEKSQPKPIELPMPFDRVAKTADVTKEERDELRAQLVARSAFRDR
jgi:hypothetical protein